MSSDFVNRKDESMFIKDWVYSNADKHKGIFIYAKSGIGKSQFITELFENELPDYIKIKVDMIGSDVSAAESYWLIKRLYRKMIQNTEKNSTLPLTERLSLDSNLSISFYLGVNVSLSDKNGYAEEIAHIMTYLKRKLSDGNKYIIDIENFQLIEQESMDCLKQLFCVGSGHRYILEFTMDPACISSQFYHLFSQISSAIHCQIYELKKLKLQEVNVLCERKHLPLNTAQELYNKNDGNLFPLVMLPFSPISNSL